ncbi:MAG: phosphatidylserine decarboxylase family protein [Candidatus Sulfobium sp.]|jgi:phosphatidylserine decarboxylase
MARLAPEGYPFIAGFGLLTFVVAFFTGPLLAVVPFVPTLFMIYFFRDPERDVPVAEGAFLAPADGRVMQIRDTRESEYLNSDVREISIFMSPLNVHVNRAPCDGKVKAVKHNKGKYMAAYREDSSLKNENIAMVLETGYGDILVRQVAGFLARRAVCRKREGDTVRSGERYGIIKFSSRLDTYLPKDVEIKVKLGEKVRAGETVIARIQRGEQVAKG